MPYHFLMGFEQLQIEDRVWLQLFRLPLVEHDLPLSHQDLAIKKMKLTSHVRKVDNADRKSRLCLDVQIE